ncbi:D-alanyl-D-alanine carboxypeptidase/D-alanyl-D-alanine-endopeptidase (penicillin-binding protein 4) [Humibacillus xanthopallidus]|uniref:D-alanyl-D-alanine carboxypeptidase/D-alanyl-D-alanine-endopeptidase (Penicillin-binding protein 4) n=1 Tax=Humibacillus xanthopallidus TaxID=412689 RepID=A0A543PMP5_9MICO|nr:D-alanyl-D-alanine carboxypeptidase [Humibacillus xanthopallidus]TQN45348.1 D-alanyl-D-alanine carboxypeptidase/D-alanyl-D-alanine-endopeptidase (penicillin-binding protein 4) [Humibacillus xanthopallidus]
MTTSPSDPGPPVRGLTYTMATILSVLTILLGYAVLDVADAAPGVLTLTAAPPPAPTETPGTRTLPVVPQPTPSTSVGEPLPPLAGDAEAPTADGVARALRPVVARPALADSALVVRDGQTGEVLFDAGGSELRIPASTTKLLSAAAVGQAFAPDATLQTVVQRGAADDEIVLVAGGDSLINPGKGDPEAVAGRAGLSDLSDQVTAALKKAGVRAVTLRVDESYAYGPGVAPTWDPSFRPSGITGAVAMLGLSSQRATGGRVGPADPVAAVRDLFVRQLERRGIDVTLAPRDTPSVTAPTAPTGTAGTTGTATPATPTTAPTTTTTTPPATGPGSVLGRIVSAPVRDQLALALTDSDNALTEILARQASFRSGGGTTFADTGAWVVSQVAALGLDTTGVVLRDASGLSRENRVRADLLTRILVLGYDGKHAVLRRALDGLPIGGLTGTLDDRFTGADSDAAGRARAKTGTLTGANALAGSVVDDDGRLLVFAGMVAGAGTTEARAALDRFVATLAACGCR